MTLADLRKLAIRQNVQIRFRMRNGKDCVINERGIAVVPGFKGVPDFSFEEELTAAGDFTLDPVVSPKEKNPPKPRHMSRDEMAALAAAAPVSAAAADHDDE
jgi:hypothetical protein